MRRPQLHKKFIKIFRSERNSQFTLDARVSFECNSTKDCLPVRRSFQSPERTGSKWKTQTFDGRQLQRPSRNISPKFPSNPHPTNDSGVLLILYFEILRTTWGSRWCCRWGFQKFSSDCHLWKQTWVTL